MNYLTTGIDPRELVNQIRYHPWFATVFVALIIGGQAWGIVSQVDIPDKENDYYGLLIYAFDCSHHGVFERDGYLTRNPLKWISVCQSWNLFHNVKVIPLIFNIGVMPLVYLVATRLTHDRLIGLVALIAFIYNPLYTDWKSSGTYDNMWSFFLLLSVWIAGSRFSVPAYGVSVAAKSISLMYFPAWIFTLCKSGKSRKEIIITCGLVLGLALIANQYFSMVGASVGFYPSRWEDALVRNISVLWQVIPYIALLVVLNRTFIPKFKIQSEKLVFVWIICALLQNPFVYLFTMQDTYSYRYVPLAAFMSILVGITLVNIGNWYAEVQLKKPSRGLYKRK